MGSYVTSNPVTEIRTDDDGTKVSDVAALAGSNYLANTAADRIPAFVALAKQHGGVYAENDRGMSIDRALGAAGLDFTAAKYEFQTVMRDLDTDEPLTGADGNPVVVPGLSRMKHIIGTWKDGRRGSLGIAGRSYPIVQPHEAAAFGQAVVDEAGGTLVAAGAYGNPIGSRMFLAIKLPEQLLIGGQDPHDQVLVVGNSFNRETSLWGCAAPLRIACTNQAAMLFGKHMSNRFAIRHTGEIGMKIGEVRRALDITGTFSDLYSQAAEWMLTQPMGAAESKEFLKTLMPTPKTVKTDRGEDAWDLRRHRIHTIITQGEVNNMGRGTRYAAYQGVIEWLDHYLPADSPKNRAARLVDGGQIEETKHRAGRLLLDGFTPSYA